jgi:hypothetical protein
MSVGFDPAGGTPTAVRLIVAYGGGDVRLASLQRVRMALPHSSPSGHAPPELAAELRTLDGEVLHSVALHNPMQPHRDVLTDDPEQSIHRDPDKAPEGAFTVVVPEDPRADHVALMTTRPPRADAKVPALETATEIARFSLRGDTDEGAGVAAHAAGRAISP